MFFKSEDFIKFDREKLTRQLVVDRENMQPHFWSFEPGQAVPAHKHPISEEVHLVISGEGTAIIEGEERKIKEGDIIYYEVGKVHAVRNDSAGRLVIYAVIAPRPGMPGGTISVE